MNIHSIYKVDNNVLANTISRATQRLVFMAPGVSKAVAQEIDKAWGRIGVNSVNVILDVDSEIFRLGYDEIDALTVLEAKAKEKGTLISHQPGIVMQTESKFRIDLLT